MTRERLAAVLCILLAATGALADEDKKASLPGNGSSPSLGRVRAYWKALDLIGFRGVGLVAKDGRIALLEGSGGVSPTATFDIASISKSLTAVAVLRLARRHELDRRQARSFRKVFPQKRNRSRYESDAHRRHGNRTATPRTASGTAKGRPRFWRRPRRGSGRPLA
jgi:hypothetical protein